MKRISLLFVLCSLIFTSCEDEVDITLDKGEAQLVVDGFITNDSNLQTIILSRSADYFSNTTTPAVTNATVKVHGPNQSYDFVHSQDGHYIYDPSTFGALDSISFPYKLEVIYDNETYEATSILQPVPLIDSMTQMYRAKSLFFMEGYYAQFYATDFAGRDDWYWIKAYKNGELLQNRPTDFTFSKNGGMMGLEADGSEFLGHIRSAITKSDAPFELGDTSTVELLSLNEAAYNFLEEVVTQANNGGIFSAPPANIKSNIKNTSGNLENKILGVFSISSIQTKSLIISN